MGADGSFDTAYYDIIRPGIQASAAACVPYLCHWLDSKFDMQPSTLVDVGGGEGWWAVEFGNISVGKAVVVDGPGGGTALEEPDEFVEWDLRDPLPEMGQYDLALCLETAEHLPPERVDGLVADLTYLADIVVFSAAVPGQPGNGHINCQWQDWWARAFVRRGWHVDGTVRWGIWDDPEIEWWYKQNMFVAWGDAYPAAKQGRVIPCVHPDHWAVR